MGSGTYAIVKEAVHIKTGQYYACKVINKKLMEGREYMVSKYILLHLLSSRSPPALFKIAVGCQRQMAGRFRAALTDDDSLFAMPRFETKSRY